MSMPRAPASSPRRSCRCSTGSAGRRPRPYPRAPPRPDRASTSPPACGRDGADAQLLAGEDGVADDRVDLPVPLAAAEDAVVADARLHVMALAKRPEAGAEVVGGGGLAERADVVALALDRQQRGAPDPAGLDRSASIGERALAPAGRPGTRCGSSRGRIRPAGRAPRDTPRRRRGSPRPSRSRRGRGG